MPPIRSAVVGSTIGPRSHTSHFDDESYQTDAQLELCDLAADTFGDERPGLRCDLRLRQAEALDLVGRRGSQRRVIEDAIATAEAAQDTRRLGETRCAMGWLLIWISRYAEAESVLEEALRDARAAADRRTESRVISNLGLVSYHLGRNEEARDYHERDLAIKYTKGSIDHAANVGAGYVVVHLGGITTKMLQPPRRPARAPRRSMPQAPPRR